VNETPPENSASENGMAVASPVLGVKFDGGDSPHGESQQIGCEAGPGSTFEDTLPKVGAREDPRHSLLNGFSPSGGTA
jgi:hypothetical protein